MSDLIVQRDERTERRKKYKKKVDSIFNLSYKDEETIKLSGHMELSTEKIRLLDEGAVVGDDYIDFIIKKGTLAKFINGENEYLDNLTDDFVGSVNLGHMDFATFPFIIGEWKKTDLSLVDIGDERKGIDVALHLDSDSVFVQELKRQPYDIGISSEFYYHVDWESTEEVGYLVIDEVYIFAYGLVGECGNVNSSGLELKGEDMKKDEINLSTEELEEEIIEEEIEELEEEIEEEVEEEEMNLSADSDSEEVEDEEAEEVEEEDEESDEVEDDETDLDEVEDVIEQLNARISELEEQVASLSEANAKLKKTNNKLSRKLHSEKEKKEAFIRNAKGISVKLGINEEKPKAETNPALGDGIGEL